MIVVVSESIKSCINWERFNAVQYVPYQCTLSHLVTQLWLCVSALPTTKQLINAFGVPSRSTVEYLAAHLNRFVLFLFV